MSTKIEVTGTVALVSVEVDLAEWGGKYPDDDGVLGRAVKNIQSSQNAAKQVPAEIDAQILALQDFKSRLETIKPVVTGVTDKVGDPVPVQAVNL